MIKKNYDDDDDDDADVDVGSRKKIYYNDMSML